MHSTGDLYLAMSIRLCTKVKMATKFSITVLTSASMINTIVLVDWIVLDVVTGSLWIALFQIINIKSKL